MMRRSINILKINPKLVLIVCLIPVFFLSLSCKTYKTFKINVLEPAEIIVPQNIKHILIAPNNKLHSNGLTYEFYDEKYIDTSFNQKEYIGATIESLADMISYNPRFTTTTIESLEIALPVLPEEITNRDVNYLKQLCEEHQADAIVILAKTEKQVGYSKYYGHFGGYFSMITIIYNTRWMFINPFAPIMIDHKNIRDTLYYRVGGIYGTLDPEFYQFVGELMMETTDYVASDYGMRITPHFAETQRIVFNKGDKYLKKGFSEAESGNWVKASEIWQKTLSYNNPVIVSRGAFNIALSNEMEGNLKLAADWAEVSYDIFPDTINKTYLDILQERIRQQDDLMKQMDGP
ncbi:MAG: DUF6340 family protein [Bacteroidales bacterium]|jgi:tetratricopeptide (TPR) repeat protein|nr:hypothetical protein [Bacteroidales bacterium]MDI9592579.1 DUF6340 family protein [Bacteroidota bacterium]HOF80848.1 DUF6340 family protein [Bacteroidales bacterium]HOR76183.1 DUF6340 family protein [Bacteroidales bacterium]HQF01093.1 DUF6340 family protein [Bacteroidales bacterium]